MKKFVGTGVALVTPFNSDKSLDLKSLEKIVHFQIANNINYLVILGTTGESATLTTQEKEEVKSKIIATNKGRLPLVLGVGGNNTQAVLEEIQSTDMSNFDAILSVAPYYNKPTQEGIYQHFKAISKASPLPIILYNVPSRTSSNILPKTVLQLANDCKNIIGIKEASGDIVQIMRILRDKPKDFLVISGDDMTALPLITAGGSGVISVIGQGIPKRFSKMIASALEGRATQAYKEHFKMIQAIDLIFSQGNPAGIKAMLHYIGICSVEVRLPLVKATAILQEEIRIFTEYFNSST